MNDGRQCLLFVSLAWAPSLVAPEEAELNCKQFLAPEENLITFLPNNKNRRGEGRPLRPPRRRVDYTSLGGRPSDVQGGRRGAAVGRRAPPRKQKGKRRNDLQSS